MRSSHPLKGLGENEDEALIVVVPSLTLMATTDTSNLNWTGSPTKLTKEEMMNLQEHKSDDVIDINQVPDIAGLEVGKFYQVAGLEIAGLGTSNNPDQYFYCRNDTINLISNLNKIMNGIKIDGPPGVGKSTTVWLWVCNQVKYNNKVESVLWVHLDSRVKIVHIRKTGFFKVFPKKDNYSDYIFKASDDIVVIDGVTHANLSFESDMIAGFEKNKRRKMVSVSSMSTLTNPDHYSQIGISFFTAMPWSLDEYYEATKDDLFYEKVKSKLLIDGSDDTGEISRTTLVEQKYYYAGCSARWMFQKNIDEVRFDINFFFQ